MLASVIAPPPNALWRVVHDLCVTDRRITGAPAPCMSVSLKSGWAVVKDPNQPTHILLVPLQRIAGIESPRLLNPDAPNYWQGAWEARRSFEHLVGQPVPREDIALVINSVTGRTQDQLHIHIDCIKPKIARVLRNHAPRIGLRWRSLGVPLEGRRVLVRRLDGADFGSRDPFKLLAEGAPGARAAMGDETLAAVGAVFPGGGKGFILISRRAHPAAGDLGSGEEILDHRCQILTPSGKRS